MTNGADMSSDTVNVVDEGVKERTLWPKGAGAGGAGLTEVADLIY